MTIIIDGTTGVPVSPVTGTLAVANGGTGVTTSTGSGANVLGTSPSISGAVMTTMASSVITSGTAVASTSGTSIDFTSIPSWVKRITVMLSGVSTSGTSPFLIQIGSGSVDATGYISTSCGVVDAAAVGSNSSTAGFIIRSVFAANVLSGNLVITNVSGNIWVSSHTTKSNTTSSALGGGDKTLSGTLDRVRITTVNGTDTFDAGSINILYE